MYQIVGLLGLEPRTNGLKVRCSNQLSYSPKPNLTEPVSWSNRLCNHVVDWVAKDVCKPKITTAEAIC